VESSILDVSSGNVTNCAVPCYFVACGLTPGADPPGTYKPCFQAGVRLEHLPVQDSTTLELDLIDAGERSVYHTSATVAAGQAQPDSTQFWSGSFSFTPRRISRCRRAHIACK